MLARRVQVGLLLLQDQQFRIVATLGGTNFDNNGFDHGEPRGLRLLNSMRFPEYRKHTESRTSFGGPRLTMFEIFARSRRYYEWLILGFGVFVGLAVGGGIGWNAGKEAGDFEERQNDIDAQWADIEKERHELQKEWREIRDTPLKSFLASQICANSQDSMTPVHAELRVWCLTNSEGSIGPYCLKVLEAGDRFKIPDEWRAEIAKGDLRRATDPRFAKPRPPIPDESIGT